MEGVPEETPAYDQQESYPAIGEAYQQEPEAPQAYDPYQQDHQQQGADDYQQPGFQDQQYQQHAYQQQAPDPAYDPYALPEEEKGYDPFAQISPDVSTNTPPPIVHKPPAVSDPSYQQPTVASLRNRDNIAPKTDSILLSGVTGDDPALAAGSFSPAPPPPPAPLFAGLPGFAEDAPKDEPKASPARDTALYTGTLTKNAAPALAVNADGVPNYVPPLPEPLPDEGSLGRRVAAGAWVMFSVLLLISALKAGMISGFMIVIMPMLIVAALLFSGREWTSTLGLIAGMLLGFLHIGFAALIIAGSGILSNVGIALPMGIMYGVAGVGLLIIVANMVMLMGTPGLGRSMFGAVLMVVPLVALTGWASTLHLKPLLTKPVDDWQSSPLGGNGLLFVKPGNWANFKWEQVSTVAVPGRGLSTEPNYHFLDRSQDLLFAIYKTELPQKSLSSLFGPKELYPLEKEVGRGFAPTSDPEVYQFNGAEFTEMNFEGTTEQGDRLSVTLSRVEHNDQFFYFVLTRDAKSTSTTAEDATEALNQFFKGLKLLESGSDLPSEKLNVPALNNTE
jgi:hypothetical protein